jgi:Secretion system C-terminal sorting domain
MKILYLFLLISLTTFAQNFNLQRSWGAYAFDERFILNDSKVDSQGNLYIVGTAIGEDVDFYYFFEDLTNPYHNSYIGGNTDGFILKVNTQGELVWGTFVGGLNDDTIGAIDIDTNDAIYIVGSTNSESLIASPNAYQPNKAAGYDFMVAHFLQDGTLDWSTYYGGNGNETIYPNTNVNNLNKVTVLAHDQSNHLYFSGGTDSSDIGTAGAFQSLIKRSHGALTKFSNTGSLIWTTYYTQDTDYITSLSVSDSALYVSGIVDACESATNIPFLDLPNTYYGTPNGYMPEALICYTQFLSKFSFDGQREWGTYYGNTTNISTGINNAIKTYQDKVYLTGSTWGNSIATTGTFQSTFTNYNNSYTPFLVQFNQDGTRNWGTYNGLTENYVFPSFSLSSVNIDQLGNTYLVGTTRDLTQNIATPNAFQTSINGGSDGFVSKFDTNGQKIWGMYFGGSQDELEMNCYPYSNGFYLVGTTKSTSSIALPSNSSSLFLHNPDTTNPHNIFIEYFTPISLSTKTFETFNISFYPNPSNGNFTISCKSNFLENSNLEIYDILGKRLFQQKLYKNETVINLENFSKGIYIAKITKNDTVLNSKISVE